MSYSINFKVKIEGIDRYFDMGYCDANTTYNVREMIVKSTGLEWKNCENNGYCKDVIPYIRRGRDELLHHPEKYREYEATNGWGTVTSTMEFFNRILRAWDKLIEWEPADIVDVVTFWVE